MTANKGRAITGLPFLLVNASTQAVITGGASGVSLYLTQDGGTQAAITNTVTEAGQGVYTVDLTAAQMNYDEVALLVTHTSAIPVQLTIPTRTT